MSIVRRGSIAAAALSVALLLPEGLQAQGQARFVTVYQGPDELEADRILAEKLGGSLVAAPEKEEYKVVIDDLVADSRPEGTVAHVTPYAFVVAEMLGARLSLIATSRSRASGSTTYGAWLVVRRSEFPTQGASGPTLAQVMEYLQQRSSDGRPARFVYHDKFSTSSYFFPSLYFRGQRVFAQGDETEKGISTISVERLPGSSSDLVSAVADGRADVASVWDGTKARFSQTTDPRYAQTGRKVWFVRLPGNLPCDLLVATRKADGVEAGIRSRLKVPDPIAPRGTAPASWDVESWVPWSDAEETRMALAELRRQAAASTLPVVVDVRSSATAPVSPDEVEAVRRSLRLAGTELVAKDEYSDYYKKSDIVWELARIHDGALRMTIRYDHFLDSNGSEVTQRFEISFLTPTDLTRRVTLLINARMHRIRPVWLYRDTAPTVLRDVAFEIPEREQLPFQEILWKDPQRNDYTLKEYKLARLEKSDFNKLELEKAAFPERADKKLAFEPMGRQAFRVLLLRPTRERRLFQALTVAFVALFGLAALGLAWDVWCWRRQRVARPETAAGSGSSLEGAWSGVTRTEVVPWRTSS